MFSLKLTSLSQNDSTSNLSDSTDSFLNEQSEEERITTVEEKPVEEKPVEETTVEETTVEKIDIVLPSETESIVEPKRIISFLPWCCAKNDTIEQR